MSITFAFAKWKVEEYDKVINTQLRFPDDEARRKHISYLRGQREVWRLFMEALCQHQWSETDENGKQTCSVCGLKVDQWFDLSCLREDTTPGCHNCRWHDVQGGDWVPYGMSGARLPEVQYCGHPSGEDLPEGDYPKFNEDQLEQGQKGTCLLWEGKKHDF